MRDQRVKQHFVQRSTRNDTWTDNYYKLIVTTKSRSHLVLVIIFVPVASVVQQVYFYEMCNFFTCFPFIFDSIQILIRNPGGETSKATGQEGQTQRIKARDWEMTSNGAKCKGSSRPEEEWPQTQGIIKARGGMTSNRAKHKGSRPEKEEWPQTGSNTRGHQGQRRNDLRQGQTRDHSRPEKEEWPQTGPNTRDHQGQRNYLTRYQCLVTCTPWCRGDWSAMECSLAHETVILMTD